MRLQVQAPFHLEATVRLLQRRPGNGVDLWQSGSYLRALPASGVPTLCRVENLGTVDAPRLEVAFEPRPSRAAAAELRRALSRTLGLEQAPGFGALERGPAPLRVVARALRGARPPRFPTLFEAFGRIIPYQQLSLEAGSAIAARFVERLGQRVGPVWLFPDAERVAAAGAGDFEGLGLNRSKAASLRAIAASLAAGELSEEELGSLPVEVAERRLEALRGVGPWTASLILLRGLGRLEVFPRGDAGAARGLGRLLGPGVSVEALAGRAGERRGWLYFFALGARLLGEGLIRPAG